MPSKFYNTLLGLLLFAKLNSQVANTPLQTFANPALYNLSDSTCPNIAGHWQGVEVEYYDNFKQEKGKYTVSFNLTQLGNRITGTSFISFNNGAGYGKFNIRGLVAGNTFYFEEYELVEQKFTEPGATWCLRTGELAIKLNGSVALLEGANYKGYAAFYYFNCTAAVSLQLSKNLNDTEVSKLTKSTVLKEDYKLQLHPNPANMEVTVAFKLPEDRNVRIELFTLSGELIGTITNDFYPAGLHQKPFSLHPYPAGAYLIRMQAGTQIFAKTLVIAR